VPKVNRPKLDRQRCPVCERFIAVDIVGCFMEHGIGALCEGSFYESSNAQKDENL
jgi:hypothetical protein